METTRDAPSLWRRRLGNRTGYAALAFSLLSLGGVLCFLFPEYLTSPQLRAIYSVDAMRGLLRFGIVAALVLGTISVLAYRGHLHGRFGLALGVLAVVLGGSRISVEGTAPPARYLGLDWLVLDFFVVAMIFVSLERLFLRVREQKIFRQGWKIDALHYATSHLLIGLTVLLITAPALWLSHFLAFDVIGAQIARQPVLLQFVEVMFVADLTQYSVHRLFHRVPFLWRFHAIHHSSQRMDWLAGSRLHLVDIVVTRGLTFLPISLLGFSDLALQAYLVFVAAQAVFIHSNTSFELSGLRWVLTTPAFHHWHHSADPAARDRNFAVSLPILDRIFGTAYFPKGRWPDSYGIEGNPVRENYLSQVVDPFLGRTA